MNYGSIGIIALLVLLIINFDVFFKRKGKISAIPAHLSYRIFLISILAYHLIDSCWGLFYSLRIIPVIYVVTVLYFISMATSVFLWTLFVIEFLNEKNVFRILLFFAGLLFLIFELSIVIINIFKPIAFWFDEKCDYHPETARYVNFAIQVLMYIITAIYMVIIASKTKGKAKRRHLAIGFFSFAMTIFIVGQAKYPLLPFYSIGYMIGTCLLHTFVLEDEKEEYYLELETLHQKEIAQNNELSSARHLAYTDSLTGVKNKHAYLEAVTNINKQIDDGTINDFGLMVFDLNGLKIINDTKGHEEGDHYIQNGAKLICNKFKHSPIFRIGGDEFAAILEGEDLINHEKILRDFKQYLENNRFDGKIIMSCGFDRFNRGKDTNFINVFKRADKKMYECKKAIKSMQ